MPAMTHRSDSIVLSMFVDWTLKPRSKNSINHW